MDIRQYLLENKISIISFAEKLHYTPAYLGQVFSGKIKAGRKLREDIQNVTKGKIKSDELRKVYESEHCELLTI